MPTRLLLEGTDIQRLLAQVRAEHGPAAKIVAADRVRTAGMAGLFARHRYELTVEVADGAAGDRPAEPATAAGAASPAEALVALMESQERELSPERTPSPEPTPSPEFTPSLGFESQPYLGQDEKASAASAMQAAQEVSTNAAAFADVLSEYGVSGWTIPVVSNATTEPEPTEPEPTKLETAEPETAEPEVSDWVASVWKASTPIVTPLAVDILSEATTAATTPSYPAPAETTPIDPTPIDPTPMDVKPAEPTPVATPTATNPQAAFNAVVIPRYEPERLGADTPLPTALARLGLPAQLRELVDGTDSYREISRIVKLVPEAPKMPARAGEVLVIVGELPDALAAARTVGYLLNLPSSRILLAATSSAGTGIHASRRLADPEQAARRVATLRRDPGLPVVVVVDSTAASPAGPGGGVGWVPSIIERVDATSVWGVVDATRKTADSARRLADIGRVDAIAAYGCAETDDPATVLQLGIPVALIDGRVATPNAWAEMLCRRLEEVMQ